MLNRRLLGLTHGHRLRLASLVALGLAITASYAGQALLIAEVLTRAFDGTTLISLLPSLAGVIALQVLRFAVTSLRETRGAATAGEIKEDVRHRLYVKLLELGPGYTGRTRTGEIQSTVVDGVETLDKYFGAFVPQLFASLLGAAVLTAYVAILDPVVGVVVAVCALLVPIAPLVSSRLLDRHMTAWYKQYRGLYSESLDAIQGMSTLKAFNAQHRHGEQLLAQSHVFCRHSIRLVTAAAAYEAIVGLALSAGTSLAVGVGALRLAGGSLDLKALFVILLLTRECFRPLTDLGHAFHASYQALAASPMIFSLLDAAPDVRAPARSTADGALTADIALDRVTFAYGEDRDPALRGFSLVVRPGETVALVGRSGSGKTTVASLLLRFFDPQSGSISIGGTPVRELPLERLREQVAVVWQETYLFHGSVRRNLELGRPGASEAELEAAARAADVHDVITSLPDGYDTVVGERGMKLSGGERQRIAIARALLKDAPILVLDEATSSVDAASEASVQTALERLTEGRTTLVIAHRLSTVRNADRIVVLDRGSAVEAGTPAALLAQSGRYSRLVAAQQGTS